MYFGVLISNLLVIFVRKFSERSYEGDFSWLLNANKRSRHGSNSAHSGVGAVVSVTHLLCMRPLIGFWDGHGFCIFSTERRNLYMLSLPPMMLEVIRFLSKPYNVITDSLPTCVRQFTCGILRKMHLVQLLVSRSSIRVKRAVESVSARCRSYVLPFRQWPLIVGSEAVAVDPSLLKRSSALLYSHKLGYDKNPLAAFWSRDPSVHETWR